MPRKKYYKKKRSRRKPQSRAVQSRYSRWQSPAPSSTLGSLPLGDKFVFRTRYCEIVSMNPGAGGSSASHVYTANGLYDPNITGTGHQPIGFDQLVGTMYTHYTVVGARIKVKFQSFDATYAMMCGVMASRSSTALIDYRRQIENGNNKWTLVGPVGENSLGTITMGLNLGRFLGRGKPLSEGSLRGSTSANPTEQAYFHLWCVPNASVDGGVVNAVVQIDYVAILTQPIKLGLS